MNISRKNINFHFRRLGVLELGRDFNVVQFLVQDVNLYEYIRTFTAFKITYLHNILIYINKLGFSLLNFSSNI
jgi:hypothetical protein